MTAKKLPTFEGYTVDVRLKQFRKVQKTEIKFTDFDSETGERILSRYIKSLNPQSREFKELIHQF